VLNVYIIIYMNEDNFVPFFFQGEEKSLLYSLTSTRLKLLGKSQEKEEL